jgi:hypothetical protein
MYLSYLSPFPLLIMLEGARSGARRGHPSRGAAAILAAGLSALPLRAGLALES